MAARRSLQLRKGSGRGFVTENPEDGSPAAVDNALLVAFQSASGEERERLKAEIVERHIGLVRFLVRRYSGKGENYEDLVQVGMLGLLGAIDRYEADRGVRFASFARPSILGELKRHFRDKTWATRVPRRLQELSLGITGAEAELFQELGRSPTALEVAERLGATEEEVLEANEAARSYSAVSIDQPIDAGDGETGSLVDLIGEEDGDLEKLENLTALEPAIADLSAHDRRLLHMRFFRGMVQSDMAAELGVSQMQVSRELARVLSRLRNCLL
jgi:RNA polymerase sigma-B factor